MASIDNTLDFSKLESFLSAGDWVEADEENWRVMQAIFDNARRPHVRKDGTKNPDETFLSFEEISCDSLQTLDKFWLKSSKGRFGLSVQSRIWRSTPFDHSATEWERYARFGIGLEWLGKDEINREWGFFEGLFDQAEKLHWITSSQLWDRIWKANDIKELPEGYLPYWPHRTIKTFNAFDKPIEPSWGSWGYALFSRVKVCNL